MSWLFVLALLAVCFAVLPGPARPVAKLPQTVDDFLTSDIPLACEVDQATKDQGSQATIYNHAAARLRMDIGQLQA